MEHNASVTCYYELRNLVYHVIKEGCNVNYRDLDERRYNQKLFRHFEELYFAPSPYSTILKRKFGEYSLAAQQAQMTNMIDRIISTHTPRSKDANKGLTSAKFRRWLTGRRNKNSVTAKTVAQNPIKMY